MGSASRRNVSYPVLGEPGMLRLLGELSGLGAYQGMVQHSSPVFRGCEEAFEGRGFAPAFPAMEVEQFARARGMLPAMECDTALDWHHLYPHGFVDELDLVFGGRQRTCKSINGLSFCERYCGTLARCFLHTSGMVRCHQQAWVLLLYLGLLCGQAKPPCCCRSVCTVWYPGTHYSVPGHRFCSGRLDRCRARRRYLCTHTQCIAPLRRI